MGAGIGVILFLIPGILSLAAFGLLQYDHCSMIYFFSGDCDSFSDKVGGWLLSVVTLGISYSVFVGIPAMLLYAGAEITTRLRS